MKQLIKRFLQLISCHSHDHNYQTPDNFDWFFFDELSPEDAATYLEVCYKRPAAVSKRRRNNRRSR